MWRDRIVIDDSVLAGKPIIKGTRMSVEFIMDILSEGWKMDEILKSYPQLSQEDVMAAVKYSAEVVRKEKTFVL